MEVNVKYIKGRHFQAVGTAKVVTNIDTSITKGGTGRGASPMEMVLMALAGCSGMDIVSILEKMQVTFDRMAISVQGEQIADHPRVFTDIELTYKFWGKALPEAKLQRAISLSIEKYCSVAHMLDKAANLTYHFEINPAN
ncbi:MAG: OsmC family protein [Desulfitobacteriaceae bacterium]